MGDSPIIFANFLFLKVRILSIDPGIERVGFAICEEKKIISSGTITTSSNKKITERIGVIYNQLSQIVDQYQPKKIIIEKLYFFKNKKTIIEVSYIHGIIILLAFNKKIKIDFLTPLQIKEAITGNGRADKKAIQKMLAIEFGTKKTIYDDESDAIACGLAYYLLKNKY